MAGEWRTASIEEIAERVAMGPFGSSIKVETFVPSGVPVISGRHLHKSKVDDRVGFNFVSEEHADRLRNANVQRGDVIFTHAGNIGQVAYIPESAQFKSYVISQRQFYMRCNRSKVIPEFVVAYFKTPEGQHQLLANTSQVGVPSIAQPVSYLRTIEIPLPPLDEQRAIAHILGTLDDKIELNRRMSETLEAMARALFKSWFVDFDPVRAKAEGRDPGLPKPLADLFPARLVDSELGEIPEGWEVGTLGDVAESPRRSLRPQEISADAAYIALEHMPRRCIALSDWGAGDGIESNKCEFKRGEILFGKLRPYFHKVGVAPVDGVCSTDIVVVTQRRPSWFGFVLGHVSSVRFVDYTNAGSTGTKMPRTSWADMARYEVILPPEQVAAAFTSLVRPQVERMVAGIHESRTLAALRNALLPKLISGELRARDAGSALEIGA
jgi:type I restriction enzyme S subunit